MNSWRCQNCENVTQRVRNTDAQVDGTSRPCLNHHHVASMYVDGQDEGDRDQSTILQRNAGPVASNLQQVSTDQTDTITYDKFGQLIKTALESQKTSMLMEIRATVQSEIKKAISKIKEEITIKTDTLEHEQNKINKDISQLNEKIGLLEKENKDLQNNMRDIQTKINANNLTQTQDTDKEKKIVVYGLEEYQNENEYDLERRIINLFMDTMNIDLTGYIEGVGRMGRQGYKRPLKVELISKRMKRYIINNARLLKSTGIYVAEYLDKKTVQERRSHFEATRNNETLNRRTTRNLQRTFRRSTEENS